jgi:GTPase SAR1 family protein
LARRNEFDCSTNIEYCISRAHNLVDPQYHITDEDVLHARQRTTGITETEFQIGKFTWNLIDVGGQRAERRKWVHYYEGAVAMLYVASLDDFDAVLPEDPTKTRYLHLFRHEYSYLIIINFCIGWKKALKYSIR